MPGAETSGTPFARSYVVMVANGPKLEEINVLASAANWAWPKALCDIFQPRDVNLLVARTAREFVNVIESRRIHTTIVDMDSERCDGLSTVKVIRISYPRMPCILLTSGANEAVLNRALQLGVFSVIDKPVDIAILRRQLNRLFMRN